MDFNSKAVGNDEPVLTARDVARYRGLLLAKRDELEAAVGGAEPRASCRLQTTNRATLSIGPADSEAELQIQRRQSDAHLMRAIEDALGRINRGSFGVCEVCKQPISRSRLEAVPWTRVCRDCKQESGSSTGESG